VTEHGKSQTPTHGQTKSPIDLYAAWKTAKEMLDGELSPLLIAPPPEGNPKQHYPPGTFDRINQLRERERAAWEAWINS
jgi:hypothetical protein